MATTIQISKQTKNILKELKEREHAHSYDVLIKEMAIKKLGVPKSRFGSTPKIAPFSEKERLKLHEY